MPKHTKVILLEDIDGLGRAGDIVSVSDGYARNSLFPHGRAALATDQKISRAEHKKAAEHSRQQEELAKLHEQAQVLDNTELIIQVRVKDGQDIFGKISAGQIAKELNSRTKFSFKPKDIQLDSPITKLGKYDVTVSLSEDVESQILVNVEPVPESDKAEED